MKEIKGGIIKMNEAVMYDLMEYGYSNCVSKKKENIFSKKINKFIAMLSFYRLKNMAKKIDFSSYIEKNKDICGGNAVVKNTRITTATVYNMIIKQMKYNNDLKYCINEVKKEYPALKDDKQILMSVIYHIGYTSKRQL